MLFLICFLPLKFTLLFHIHILKPFLFSHCSVPLTPHRPLHILYVSLLSGCSRGVSHLLAAFLCDSHPEHPLQDMLRASCSLRRFHLAGVCQQRPKPSHLHHLQYWVQTGLHQDPQLLRKDTWHKIKAETSQKLAQLAWWCKPVFLYYGGHVQ